MQDVDLIAGECDDLIARHGLDRASTRQAIEAMLEEQPLPLGGPNVAPAPATACTASSVAE
jgi:hypothetical protein